MYIIINYYISDISFDSPETCAIQENNVKDQQKIKKRKRSSMYTFYLFIVNSVNVAHL